MSNDYQIEKISTKSSIQTVKVNGYFLHSKYDPEKEAKAFVEKNYKPNHFHILFGYGLGYIYNAFTEKLKGQKEEMIVIDPISELLSAPISEIAIFSNENDELLNKLLQQKIEKYNRRVHVIESPNYGKVLGENFKKLLKIVSEKSKLNKINENTIKVFAEDWQKNYIHNLYQAIGDRSLSELKDKFNLPVVIASGGPSLTKQLPLLKKIRNQVIIISSGSTINTLLRSNITPDIVVSIDGSEANYHHFEEIQTKEITYIYSLTSHYGIRESFRNNAFIFHTIGKDKMNQHFEKITQMKFPLIVGGGSVANFALSIAAYISKGPITIIGQDLAYTDNKTHAENNKNFKVVDESFKLQRGMFYVEGYHGEQVLTDYVFLTMKENFEDIMKRIGNSRNIYNSTEGGINLKGFKNLPFKEFCSNYVADIATKPQIQEQTIPVNLNEKREKLGNVMKEEIIYYKKIRNVLVDNLKILHQNESNTHFSERTLKKLNKNDEILKNHINRVSISSVVDPITISIENNYLPIPGETDVEAYKRVYNQNKDLYSNLLDAVDKTVDYTKELVAKIEAGIEDDLNG